MHGQRRNTKLRIVDAANGIFYKEGFARARIDVIAEAARVSKRTLYYHFDSKDALLAAVLSAQHELVLTRIAEWTGHAAGDPARMIAMLFEGLASWASTPGWQGSGFTRSVMELADMPGHPARAVARRHKAAIEAWLAEQFAGHSVANPKRIARQVMLLIEGCQSLILVHGDARYAKAASAAAMLLVAQSGHTR